MTDNEIKQRILAKLMAKNVSGEISNDGKPYTQKDLANMANLSAVPKSKNFNELLSEELANIGVTKNKIANKINELLDNDDYHAVDAGLKHVMKITGAYAPEKSQADINLNARHEVVPDNGEYLDFLMQKNQKRTVIDVENVE